MQMNKQKTYAEALAEVSVILEYTDPNLVNRIPKKLLDYIWRNKDNNYEVNICIDLGLQNQNIKKETKSIMALIYRNYFCTQEEKKDYDELLNKNQIKYEKELNAKYSYENLFKNNSINKEDNVLEETSNNQMVEYKEENIFKKIINKIKKFLKLKP